MLFSKMLTSILWVYSTFAIILTGILLPTLKHTFTDMHHFISTLKWYFPHKVSPDFLYLWTPSYTVPLLQSSLILYHVLPLFISAFFLDYNESCLKLLMIFAFFYNCDFLAYDGTSGRWSVKACWIEPWLLRTVSL